MRLLFLVLLALSSHYVFAQYGVTAPVSPGVTLPPELQLTIESLPAENLAAGKVMQRCRFTNEPEINYLFDFRWLDQNDRVFTNGDTLYLTIDNLAELGNYTCEAIHQQTAAVYQAKRRVSREAGSTASAGLPVEPSEPTSHRVIIRHNIKEARIGEPYEMQCLITPKPSGPVTYQWMYNGRLISQDSVLRIPALSPNDLSEFVCKAQWGIHDRRGNLAPLASIGRSNVRMQPTPDQIIEMAVPPGAIMVTNPGESRELHCEYPHFNPKAVQWFFNNQPLDSVSVLNSTGQFFMTFAMRVSIISIRSVRSFHGGKYECRVDGVVKQVTVMVQGDQGLELSPRTETVNEGEAVEFHCRATSGEPNVNRHLVWFFQTFNSPDIVPLRFDSEDGFRRIDDPTADHTSFINKMSVVASDEGNYICRLPSRNTEAIGELHVNPSRLLANIYITPSLVRVRAHQAIDMECYTVSDRQILPQFHVRDSSIRYISNQVSANRVRFRIEQGLAASYNGTVVECSLQDGVTSTSAIIIIEDVCPQGYRRCGSGQCLPIGRFCDGQFDCDDRSDEDPAFCNPSRLLANIYITPSLVRVRAHQAIDMECYTVNGGQMSPQFHVRNPSVRFVSTPVSTNRVRLRIEQGLAASYNGTVVECSLQDGVTSTSAIIIIEDVCPQGYRRCRSGQCLPIGRFCDGQFDCDDRSDEDPAVCKICDPIAKKCEVNRGRPPIKDIYMIHWVCDGEDDCGNGWDEANCPTSLFASCVDRQFTCTSSRLNIPLAFVCDKDQDCSYGEDEQNCGAPVIEHTSNYRYNTNRGGTVRIECTVRGHPLPRVIWRFNWGCLPENGRYRVTHTPQNCGSRMPSVTSVLTITDVQHGDDGIYNCEALSGSVRAMSNDYFVMLDN